MVSIYQAYIDREIAAGHLETEMSGRVLTLSAGTLVDGTVMDAHTYQPKGTGPGDTLELSKQQKVAYLSLPVVYKVYA